MPLSFAQERLWFLEQLEPDKAVYNICRASRLTGKLNLSALKASLNEIVRRHEVLRSAIRFAEGRPVQIVAAPFELKIAVMDLQPMSDREREQAISRRIQQAADKPFDFSAGRFLRAALFRVGNDEHILVLTTHHIVSDAWSMGILTRELWSLYEAYAAGDSSPLEDLQIQYADFAVWQRKWLQGEALDAQVSYWKKRLKDLPNLNLPADRPRPARQSFHGARTPITLPQPLTAAINELGNQYGVTPFMTLLAAFQVLLYRYSGQEDIVIGSPIANRVRPELEPLIGFFVNMLVLRSDLSGNPTFRELLARVREVCLGAYAHQDFPFEKLVLELQPERDQSRNPLFQVMFVLQNATRPFTDVQGLRIEPVETENTRSQFDLSLFLRERDARYVGYFQYSTDLFDASTIERMAGHLETLLEGIVANSDQPISTLPLLSDAERHQLLVEWNDTATDYPKDKCIHELFEEQVERTPDRVALEFEDKRLDYRELNARANQLAHYLRGLGVGPEQLVGVCIERSLEMVIGLLAVLKAGAAYLPLDLAYPKERLAFMVDDARISVLLTQERQLQSDSLTALTSQDFQKTANIVSLDRDWENISECGQQNPERQAKSANLAYVIYTSGSTGEPKGVQVSHQSIVNCLHSMRQHVGLAESDVFLAVTTLSFDISALEVYLPLMTGAKIILASRDNGRDAKQLLEKLTDYGVTAMQATPSTWQLLLDAGWQGNESFKVLCGGEALSRRLADELVGRRSLWNLYGPTEATIWSTIYRVQPRERAVPIGRPIENTQLYVVDSNLQPAPVGVYGELCIGGAGISQGYLNRPELTAERFIPNPFSTEFGSRLYRTGDMVRYRRDGNIEYLGRGDNQVKIRGHRVELGEIEAALNQHPAVRESVMVLRERESGVEKLLVAYLVPGHQPAPPVTELHSFVAQKLPTYMVPSAFVSLQTIPRTPNGKVDRNALPSADGSRPDLRHAFVEPQTETEALVAQIWRHVLKIDRIGIYDNFFELGGHSLSAVRVLSILEEIFQKNITIRDFFESPSVSGLVNALQQFTSKKRKVKLRPIVRMPRSGAFPLSLSQRQLWTLDQLLPGSFFLNMPYSYRLVGLLDIEVLRKSLQAVIRRHEAFHIVFGERKGRPIQFVSKVPEMELPLIDLRRLPPQERNSEFARLAMDDAGLPFDLEKGPLIRVQLIHMDDEEYVLLVTVHHIVCDDWSMQVFRHELMTFYGAFLRGDPCPLPDLSIQMIDFVCWQRSTAMRGILKKQIGYWKNQLAERSPTLRFKHQDKVKKNLTFQTSTKSFQLDTISSTGLSVFAFRENYTPFMFLFAVFSLTLYSQTEENDIRIGTIIANRSQKETERLIGNFLNVIVLHTRICPAMTFADFLQEVRKICLDAVNNQDVPFGQVARCLAKENPELKRHPLFQVMFIYQKRIFQPETFGGLTIASSDGKYRRANPDVLLTTLDLIFDLRETSTALTGSVTYKTHVFDENLIARWVVTFQEITKRVLRCPKELISNILVKQ